MRRLLAILVLAAAGVAGVDVLADLTQTRPEVVDPDSRAEVRVDVTVDGYLGPADDAALTLWAVCLPQLGSATRAIDAPSIADGHLTAIVSPAPGGHARTRLRGCLDDVTLDRVKGHLVSITELTAPA